MSDVAIVAFGAVSALGEGAEAVTAGEPGSPARLGIARDAELANAGLDRPFAARVSLPEGTADRATALFERALGACAASLDDAWPAWRQARVGLVMGTSSGGMRAAEAAFASLARGGSVADAEAATYFGPFARGARVLGRRMDPAMQVLGACASSTFAIGLGARWLERDACDLVLAGGFDDVTVFVASGFEVLRATTASPPSRPFRAGRDGMSLGEGAAVLALAPSRVVARERMQVRAYVAGFGAACDAVHLTAPDREGRALARAVGSALREAGNPRVDLVSPHATATPFNDPAEAHAIAGVLREHAPVVHPFKAQVGHTLGAAGALELLTCVDAIERGVLPAAAGEGALDVEPPVRLLDRAVAGSPRVGLKLSSAFGGANAAVVVSASPGRSNAARPVHVSAAVHVPSEPELEHLASLTGIAPDRLARADGLVRLALAAIARLEATGVALDGAGVVVGSALATLETNALFAARIRERGARAAEPRRFPYTSPNAVAGECSIAFGLTGPGFSVSGGMHAGVEALAAASVLVGAGDAERVVVVAVDEVGPTARAFAGDTLAQGAVALLVTASAEGAVARVGALELARGVPIPGGAPAGHQALLPLASRPVPRELVSASPPDAFARVALEPV
ncbi:MAG TPA: beta-ketoacyl synthase N-terminal-like domain-containing protein [Polyangiaceae bacterium]